MKTTLFMLLAFCLGATTTQAQWGNRIRGNGNEVTETREVGDYDEIQVSHIFKVELVPGTEGTLTLEGAENLLEYVITKVSGKRLKITVEKGVQLEAGRNSDGIRIRVPVTDLRAVEVSGAADLVSKHTFDFPSLKVASSGASEVRLAVRSEGIRISLSGASEIYLEGRTGHLEVRGSGASNLDAYKLEAREVDAERSGATDVRVHAKETLTARASGAGNIRYRGNPGSIDKKSGRAANIIKS